MIPDVNLVLYISQAEVLSLYVKSYVLMFK